MSAKGPGEIIDRALNGGFDPYKDITDEILVNFINKKLKVLKKNDKQRCQWTYKYIKSGKGLTDDDFPNGGKIPFRISRSLTDIKSDYERINIVFGDAIKIASRDLNYDLKEWERYIDIMNAKWRQHKLRVKRQGDSSKKNSYYFLSKSVIDQINKYAEREGIDRNKAIEVLLMGAIKDRNTQKDQAKAEANLLSKYENIKEENERLHSELSTIKNQLNRKTKRG